MSSSNSPHEKERITEIERGQQLTEEQAKEVERVSSLHLNDIDKHLNLIGYYARRTPEAVRKRFFHILWLIENNPGCLAWPEIVMLGIREDYPAHLFDEAKSAWLKQIDNSPTDAVVLGHAGLFLIERDFDIGERLLRKAMNLEPLSENWPQYLSQYTFLQARNASPSDQKKLAVAALDAGKRFLQIYGEAIGRQKSPLRIHCLELCARSAYWACDFADAKLFANEHLRLTKDWSIQPKSCQSILGLIALKEGDLKTAKKSLLFLKKHSQVDKWDLQLANDLLLKGEVETVIQYLKKCKKLGHFNSYDLDEWLSQLAKGHTVTFV